MIRDYDWDGVNIQQELLRCEVVAETRVTDAGVGEFYYLKLGTKLIPVGISEHFSKLLQFALKRNAEAFESLS